MKPELNNLEIKDLENTAIEALEAITAIDAPRVETGVESSIREFEGEVLYQKMGEKWYAFTTIQDDVFMTPVAEEIISSIRSRQETRG